MNESNNMNSVLGKIPKYLMSNVLNYIQDATTTLLKQIYHIMAPVGQEVLRFLDKVLKSTKGIKNSKISTRISH